MHPAPRRFTGAALALAATAAVLAGAPAQAQAAPTQTSPVAVAPVAAAQTHPRAAKVSTEYANALKTARQYLAMAPFSKRGLYDQLTSRYGSRFSKAAGRYAVENVRANWRAQAVRSGRAYLAMGLSREEVRQQLKSAYGEKFTKAEADYALRHLPR